MGKIFTFSGPRGVGKTSIMDDLRDRFGVRPIVPYTTRDPRRNEAEGRDYHFVTPEEFDSIRRSKGMFDVLTTREGRYGTPLEKFDTVVKEPNGAAEHIRTINLAASSALELRREFGRTAVKSLFILPECWDDIEQQMREKGIPPDQISERRAAEPTDLTMLPGFDKIIVNGYGNRESALLNAAGYISCITGVELCQVQE